MKLLFLILLISSCASYDLEENAEKYSKTSNIKSSKDHCSQRFDTCIDLKWNKGPYFNQDESEFRVNYTTLKGEKQIPRHLKSVELYMFMDNGYDHGWDPINLKSQNKNTGEQIYNKISLVKMKGRWVVRFWFKENENEEIIDINITQ